VGAGDDSSASGDGVGSRSSGAGVSVIVSEPFNGCAARGWTRRAACGAHAACAGALRAGAAWTRQHSGAAPSGELPCECAVIRSETVPRRCSRTRSTSPRRRDLFAGRGLGSLHDGERVRV
jgi:hypothetical protein